MFLLWGYAVNAIRAYPFFVSGPQGRYGPYGGLVGNKRYLHIYTAYTFIVKGKRGLFDPI
ncbi:hypothetical protein GGU45_003073 [Niabella hirudinis]